MYCGLAPWAGDLAGTLALEGPGEGRRGTPGQPLGTSPVSGLMGLYGW